MAPLEGLTSEQVAEEIIRRYKTYQFITGAVLQWTRRYRPEGDTYKFAAICGKDGRWYTTEANGYKVEGYTLNQLLVKHIAPAYIETGYVYVATDWISL